MARAATSSSCSWWGSRTRGASTGAIEAALECARVLTPDDSDGRRTIKILGPTYSGAAEELARLLSDWLAKNDCCDVWVCSGSATSVEKERFEGLAAPTLGKGGPPRVIYSATVIPDDLMLSAALEHLADPAGDHPGAEPEKTVFLVESGTLFGNRFFRRIDELNQRRDGQSLYTFIPFPRRLAQIRDIPELTQGFELKLNPQAGTALPLVEKGPMKELFPGFDPDMTQWTDGEVISHILSTITSEGARNVGIFASEVRNVLFLVKLVNRYCPDAQIFLLNNDLLFNYRMFAPDFYGAVIASSYPLRLAGPDPEFPVQGQRAETTVLQRDRYRPVQRRPGVDQRRAGSGGRRSPAAPRPGRGHARLRSPVRRRRDGRGPRSAGAKHRPCVWINLVGKDDTWPLRTLSHEEWREKGRKQHEELIPDRFETPSSWHYHPPRRRMPSRRSGPTAYPASRQRRRLPAPGLPASTEPANQLPPGTTTLSRN